MTKRATKRQRRARSTRCTRRRNRSDRRRNRSDRRKNRSDRRKNRSARRSGRRKCGGAKQSIYKRYDEAAARAAGIFSNKLYFPTPRPPRPYTRAYDTPLDEWIDKVIAQYGVFFRRDVTLPEDIPMLSAAIKRCYKEILYDKIRANRNFVHTKVLRCMAVAALVLAAKVVLQYDAFNDYDVLRFYAQLSPPRCKVGQIEKMEADMLKTTNWIACYNVQKRTGNIPGTGKKTIIKPSPPKQDAPAGAAYDRSQSRRPSQRRRGKRDISRGTGSA